MTNLAESLPGNARGDLRTPLYHQLFVVLRDKIMRGIYPDGAQLPSELELAALYAVSRITVKRALDELAAAGMVVRRRGRGTHVNYSLAPRAGDPTFGGLMANLRRMGSETTVTLLDYGWSRPPEQVRLGLRRTPGEDVLRAVRIRRLGATPFSHLTTYVPRSVGQHITREDLETTPLLALLERSGAAIGGAEQTITATLADAATAVALDTMVGAPLLSLTRIVADTAGRPIEYIDALYRPDLYRFDMRLGLDETRSLETLARDVR